MPPKKDKLKCYTRTAPNTGKTYITCDDKSKKKGKKQRKRPPPPPVPKGVRPAPPPVPKGVRPAPPPVPKGVRPAPPPIPSAAAQKKLAAEAMKAVALALEATSTKPKLNSQLKTRLMRQLSTEEDAEAELKQLLAKDDEVMAEATNIDAERYTQIVRKMEDDADTAQYARIRQRMEEQQRPREVTDFPLNVRRNIASFVRPRPVANFNMLRPEIRRNIFSFLGGLSPSTWLKDGDNKFWDKFWDELRDDPSFSEALGESFDGDFDMEVANNERKYIDRNGDLKDEARDRYENKWFKDAEIDFFNSFIKDYGMGSAEGSRFYKKKFAKRSVGSGGEKIAPPHKMSLDGKTFYDIRDILLDNMGYSPGSRPPPPNPRDMFR